MALNIDEIYEIFEIRFGLSKEEIQDVRTFDDLGLDSLAMVSILEDLEEVFHVKFHNVKQRDLDNVPKLYKYISNYLDIERKA